MSEGKCGKGKGEIGVREGKEGERGKEECEKKREVAQEIRGGHSTCMLHRCGYYMYVEIARAHMCTPTQMARIATSFSLTNTSAPWRLVLNSQIFHLSRENIPLSESSVEPRQIHCTNQTSTDLMQLLRHILSACNK